jgi:hypothetical protein
MPRSLATPAFLDCFDQLPLSIRKRAEKQFALFSVNPGHPSLHLKQVGEFWSVRITQAYRALALRDGGHFTWIWIGTHQEYERLLC